MSINTETKIAVTQLIELIESYLEAAQQHAEASMFGDDEDDNEELHEANTSAEVVYPKLLAAIEEARELVEDAEPSYTLDQIGQSCANVSIPDSVFQNLSIDLEESTMTVEQDIAQNADYLVG